MPREYDFKTLFGSEQFKDFGYIDAEQSLRVVYPLATQKFPIGNIIDRNTPADIGRMVVDETLGRDFGIICHVQLAHDRHNIVEIISDVALLDEATDGAFPSITVPCDGLIVPKKGCPFVVETFLGDCACIVVWSENYIGYMHVGRPEVMAEPSTIEKFFEIWPSSPEETSVWIGPCIGGVHYELPMISERFKMHSCETIWGSQGFCLLPAIISQIGGYIKHSVGDPKFKVVDVEPFSENESGDHSWAASDQWYRRKGRELGFSIYSPRNSAMLFVEG